MHFVFLAADPAHETVALFADLLRARGHVVRVEADTPRLFFHKISTDLAWYRFSPERPATWPDLAWEGAVLLESRGVKMLNSTRSLLLARNKLSSFACFADQGIPQPKTKPVSEVAALVPPLIIKPLFGAWSRGVVVFDDPAEAVAYASATKTPHLFQEYLSEARVVRVIATPRDAIIVREKWADEPAQQIPPRLPRPGDEAMCVLASRMVAAVGGDLMGADVLVHDGHLYALEVNGGFGFSRQWPDSAEAIVDEFVRHAEGP